MSTPFFLDQDLLGLKLGDQLAVADCEQLRRYAVVAVRETSQQPSMIEVDAVELYSCPVRFTWSANPGPVTFYGVGRIRAKLEPVEVQGLQEHLEALAGLGERAA